MHASNFQSSSVRERSIELLPGQYFDKETNLHYNGARDYDPAIGRTIQPEPLGLAGDINLYRYARDNPLTYFDPDGRQATSQPAPQSPVKSPVPPQPQVGPRPNPSQPNTIQQAIQGAANYQQCVENAMAIGGLVGACVGAATSRGSIPVTVMSLFAGALGGQFLGQTFVCTPDPLPAPAGGKP
jgi:RHS repeat-associated protein